MEQGQEQDVEAPKKRKIWIKLAVALLIIFSIGQLSAIFIPAIVGQSPKPLSLLGSILWPGLLFMSIWSLRSKRKVTGFIIGAIVGFLLHFSAGVVAGYFKAEVKAIDKAVAASNEGLPKMIDEETRLESVSIDQKSKWYSLNITLINYLVSDIDIGVLNDNFEQSIKPSTCGIPEFKLFFTEGYTVNYVYKDKNGKLISKYSILPTDCKQ